MGTTLDNFELNYTGQRIQVHRHTLSRQVVFRILFPGKVPPLIITRTNNSNLVKFWTSVPEGRQKEAEEIGTLIEEYFRTNK